MNKSDVVPVPQSFHDNFEIVARYYGVRRTGEYEEMKEYARKSLREFREFTLQDFANMASWMVDYLPDSEPEGVIPCIDYVYEKKT